VENNTLTIDITDVYNLLDIFDEVTEDVQILQILLLLIDIPIIAISIYLVSYSYSLIKRQKKETIGIIKTRGGSWQQIITFLVGESIVVIGVTLISGLTFGYIISGTILRSVDFLDFSGQEIPVIISPGLVQILFLFVVLLTVILNLSAIIQYTRMTIQESIIPVVRTSSFWKRYYLDIVATLLGLSGYYAITELGKTIGSGIDSNPLLPVIFLIVGVPTPFFLFFGSILLIARFFPILIDKIAQILWKRRGKLGAFALRNVVRHKEAASQAVILITLAISYTIISGSLAISVDETAKMGYYHYSGADLKVNIVGPYGDGVVLNTVKNVTGVSKVTQTFFANSPSETGTQYYIFCFVDPETYLEAAFFDDDRFGLSAPLSTLIEKISDNKSIILYKKNLDSQPNLEINDKYGYHFYNESLYYQGVTDHRNYTIAGTFNHWPQYQEHSWAPAGSIFAVGSIGLFLSLHQHEYLGIYDTSVLAKLEPGSDTQKIYETVKYLSEQTIHTYSAKLDYENYIASAERRFLLAVLNTALTACIILSVLGSIMFSLFTYLERGKEIGVERALGMTRTQTAKLFTMEGLTILLFGLVIGLGVGITNTSIFLLVIQMGRTIPPIVVDYPFSFILYFLVLVIVVAAIGTIILAVKSTRKDISRVLKVE
jgi:putative ABC transport system permease protein